MSDELRRFERWYPNAVPYTTPSQADRIFEERMEREIERNRAQEAKAKEAQDGKQV
jgi:hypothetical protein